jgi:transcriptional regulator with PAS, ATPase and Fis domain
MIINTVMKDEIKEQEYFYNMFNEMWPHALEPIDLKTEVEKYEIDSITDALMKFEGNQTKAAKALSIGRTCLIAKMKKYDIV